MQKKITFWVVSFHALLILVLLFSPMRKVNHPTKHIAVRMTQMRPMERTVSAPIASSGPARTSPSKKPASKKTENKAESATNKSAKEKPAQKKTEKKTEASDKSRAEPSKSNKPVVVERDKKRPIKPAVPKKLVEELEEAFAKIEEKGGKVYSSSKLEVPRLAAPAQTESFFAGGFREYGEPSYQETLVDYLHQSLNLPEYGEVKIQLSLYKDGTVAKLTVLKAESSKNKAYLEKNLPLLKFPSLEKEETFVFTFCNEI